MFRSIRTLRSIPRIKDIAFVLARHGFHQLAAYLQAPVTARLRRLFSLESSPSVVEEPKRLRLVFQDLGPTFIKFGQLLSTRPDLLPEPYIRELSKLQAEVTATPVEQILDVITEDLGELPTLFREFEREPLATASIGQVHRAVTVGGTSVVVKVRKKGLRRVIEQDIQVLRLLVDVIGEWPFFQLHDICGILETFERSIGRELDFTFERRNIEKMAANLELDGLIHIPRVHSHLCSRRVLTMDYVPGKKFSEVRAADLPPGRGRALASAVAAAFARQAFEDGLYHADLHPGNLILLPDGRVGLIDFGSIGRCTPEMMEDLLLLIYYLLKRDYVQTSRMVLKLGRPVGDVDVQKFTFELMDTLEQYHGQSMQEIDIGGVLTSFFEISLRYQVALPPQYVMLGRTLISLQGLVRSLAPDCEIFSLIEPELLKVVRRRWAPGKLLRELEGTLTELATALRSTPVHLSEVLRKAAEGSLRFETSLKNSDRLERRLEFIGQKVPDAILVAATIIASSLLLSGTFEDGGSTLQLTLGAFGFVSSILLAFWVALRQP